MATYKFSSSTSGSLASGRSDTLVSSGRKTDGSVSETDLIIDDLNTWINELDGGSSGTSDYQSLMGDRSGCWNGKPSDQSNFYEQLPTESVEDLDLIIGQLTNLGQELDTMTVDDPVVPSTFTESCKKMNNQQPVKPQLQYSKMEDMVCETSTIYNGQQTLQRSVANDYVTSTPTKKTPLDKASEKIETDGITLHDGCESSTSSCQTSINQQPLKQVTIKVYNMDDSCKAVQVDERTTVAQLCALMMQKNRLKPGPTWTIMEHLPDLHIERQLEAHELIIGDAYKHWLDGSANRFKFLNVPNIDAMFDQPSTGCDGSLYLKADGKKTWEKFRFVIQGTNLCYYPKTKSKSSSDIQCLESLPYVSVYTAIGWKKKYKSMTDFGFALKPAAVQEHSKEKSRHIKYLCADDRATLEQWVCAIRLTKHGSKLLQNPSRAKDSVCTPPAVAQDKPDLEFYHGEPMTSNMQRKRASSLETLLTDDVVQDGSSSPRDYNPYSHSRKDSTSSGSGTLKRQLVPILPLTKQTQQLFSSQVSAETDDESDALPQTPGTKLKKSPSSVSASSATNVQKPFHYQTTLQRSATTAASAATNRRLEDVVNSKQRPLPAVPGSPSISASQRSASFKYPGAADQSQPPASPSKASQRSVKFSDDVDDPYRSRTGGAAMFANGSISSSDTNSYVDRSGDNKVYTSGGKQRQVAEPSSNANTPAAENYKTLESRRLSDHIVSNNYEAESPSTCDSPLPCLPSNSGRPLPPVPCPLSKQPPPTPPTVTAPAKRPPPPPTAAKSRSRGSAECDYQSGVRVSQSEGTLQDHQFPAPPVELVQPVSHLTSRSQSQRASPQKRFDARQLSKPGSQSHALPPPPPRRADNTQLSSKTPDSQKQTKNFILNLDRAILRKKNRGVSGGAYGADELPLPPPPVVDNDPSYLDLGDLPPPPAELLQGLREMWKKDHSDAAPQKRWQINK